MNRRLILAAAIAAGSAGLTGSTWYSSVQAQELDSSNQKTQQRDLQNDPYGQRDLQQGQQDKMRSGARQEVSQQQQGEVREVLARTADAVLTGRGMQEVRSMVSSQTAQRLERMRNQAQSGQEQQDNRNLAEQDQSLQTQSHNQDRQDQHAQNDKELEKQVQQFQKNWKDKYNQDFNVKADQLAMADFRIEQGDLRGEARLAGERTGPIQDRNTDLNQQSDRQTQPGTPGTMTPGSDETPGSRSGTAGQTGTGMTSGAQSTTPGAQSGMDRQGSGSMDQARTAGMSRDHQRQVTVTMAESHGLPETRILLKRQGGDWKIDTQGMSSDQLSSHLVQQVRKLNDMKDQWPDNADEAGALATHAVLAAFSDNQGTSAQQGLHRQGDRPGAYRGTDMNRGTGRGQDSALDRNAADRANPDDTDMNR